MVQNSDEKIKNGARWWVLYLIVGSIWYFGQPFNKAGYDELIILIIAILAGIFYNPLKEKLHIKLECKRKFLIEKFVVVNLILMASKKAFFNQQIL